MSSQLNVDTIVDKAGSGGATLTTPTLTGMSNTSTATSEGGAVTTNIAQGLLKGWLYFSGTGTPSITDSLNFSSITDNAVGRYTPTYTNNMASAIYSATVNTSPANNNSGLAVYASTFTTSNFFYKNYENGTNYDSGLNNSNLAGDLA